jgi:uncharacterized membrane protein YraQ (UPF0718 family)
VFALAIALSLAGLAIGPALAALGKGRVVPSAALDGLTLGLVPALIGLHLLPHLSEHLGPAALALPAAGFVGLWLAERRSHNVDERVGRSIVVPAIVIHSLSDGAGLGIAAAAADAGSSTAFLLPLAIILHRMPEGLFLVTTLLPHIGWRRTLTQLGLVAVATVVGAVAGRELLEDLPHEILDAFVAVGLGVMLRLVVHSHGPGPGRHQDAHSEGVAPSGGADADSVARRRAVLARGAGGAGFVVGLGLALAIPMPDETLVHAAPHELSIADSFGSLFVSTAPMVLLGLLAAAMVRVALPRRRASWLRDDSTTSQALGGALLSLKLLGWPLTIARVAVGALLSLGLARLTAAGASPAAEPTQEGAARRALPAGVRAALADTFGPTLDRIAAWYVLGLIAAAALETLVEPGIGARIGAPADVVVGALAAIPLAVGSYGAIPLAAVMIHKGVSVGAALAFLLVAPATSIAALGVIRRRLGGLAALRVVLGSVGCAIAAGIAANALTLGSTILEIHTLAARDHAAIEWVCAAAMAALLLVSLLRLGPREWFGAMAITGHAHAEHDHAGHNHAGHDHGDGHGHAAQRRDSC